MTWSVDYSSRSLKFLKQNHLSEDFVKDAVKLALQKFGEEEVNIDVKRPRGEWEGFQKNSFG
jgi:mRNA-degrading endonuclease RelE of RelBE toxin-antitoxin system